MEWFSNNWFWLLFAALFIGMHFFGFGCGAHGKHGSHGGKGRSEDSSGDANGASSASSGEKKSHGSCH